MELVQVPILGLRLFTKLPILWGFSSVGTTNWLSAR
jgi:hypothetical protein